MVPYGSYYGKLVGRLVEMKVTGELTDNQNGTK